MQGIISILRDPQSRGYRVGNDGGLRKDNPYPQGSNDRLLWEKGYEEGVQRREVSRTRRFR